MSNASTTQQDSSSDLARHLSGIKKALVSVARLMGDGPRSTEPGERAVRSQLEWAASHLKRAIQELTEPESAPTDASRDESRGEGAHASADGIMGDLMGHGRAITVPEILGFVSSLGRSGILRVESGDECFLIQLDQGAVVYASSEESPEEQRLGDVLIAQGAISREVLEQAVLLTCCDQNLLGRGLVDEGLITHKQLCIALSFQVQALFHRMFLTENAVYSFEGEAELGRPDDIRLNVTTLLLESARTTDEDQHEAD